MAAVTIYVVGSIQPAAVLASQLATPCVAVLGDDEAHTPVNDRNALDVGRASCRTAVDVLFPLMVPSQSVTGGARLGEDGGSDIEWGIVVSIVVDALLLVEGGLCTMTARIAGLVAAKTDV